MRELQSLELQNVAFLTANDVPFGTLEVTKTGLGKSILDATAPFREFLQEFAIHDFDRQPQGPDFKVTLPATLVRNLGDASQSQATLYRPVTKSGDPRVWFRDLPAVLEPGHILAAIWSGSQFWLMNLSELDLTRDVNVAGHVRDIIGGFVKQKTNSVESLLSLLRAVSEKGFIAAPVKGATAVGRLLESELGIAINSRRDPDYQGIEIKSSRKSTNRTTLFAKTPDWSNSKYKGSKQLLDAYGYDRDGRQKLSCTIGGIVTNSQGLRLRVDEKKDQLHVFGADGDAVQWDLDVLRHSLVTKHNETFWVKAESKLIDEWEHIRFRSVQHTQKPIVSQLPALLRDGKITVDFLIREDGDKGYLFKLLPKNLGLLFPPATSYELSPVDLAGDGSLQADF
jgi:hypothetical protein